MMGTIVNFTTMHEYTCIAKTFDLNNLPVTSLIFITILKITWIDPAAICSL